MSEKFKRQIASAIVLLATVAMLAAEAAAAQTRSKRNVVPRVGIIKNLDEIRSKILDSCTSHFIQPTKDSVKDEYIFISTAFVNTFGNFDVIMNLDGRNVWLAPIETTLQYSSKDRRVFAQNKYGAGNVIVTLNFEVQPDAIYPHPAKIVIRNGSAARTIRAFVVEQCSGGE